jgi:MFS family permease
MRARLGLAIVCAGALVGPFDTTVNTAFPVITEAFALGPRDIQWVVIAFVLTQSAFALVFGHLGDRIGHRRVFAAGLTASAVGHAAVALAPDFASFVAMRAVQGVAVGVTLACAPALATLMFPPQAKARVLAIYAGCASAGMAIAPWLGGLLLEAFGWPGVYWFRVPLSLAVLALLPLVPAAQPNPAQPAQPPGRFDWPGALGLSTVLTCVVLGLAGPSRPELQAYAPWLLLAGVVGAVAFVRHETRAPHPVLRMTPFRSSRFSALQAASIAVNFGCFANLLVLPYVLTGTMGTSITTAGLMLSAYPTGSVLGNLLSGRLAGRWSAGTVMVTGLAIAAAGLGLTAVILIVAPDPWPLAIGMAASGLGLGTFNVGYMDETTTLLPREERGVAGSLVNVTRLLGVVLGAAGIGALRDAVGSVALTFGCLGAGLLGVAAAVAVVERRSA